MNLLDRRCFHHPLREAAVQCPSCKRSFCRECVTEHAGRMICVACVAKLTGAVETASPSQARWVLLSVAGILVAWLVFYYVGRTLARIPSEFHTLETTAPFPRGSVQMSVRTALTAPRPEGAVMPAPFL
jgi:hypothetical protein